MRPSFVSTTSDHSAFGSLIFDRRTMRWLRLVGGILHSTRSFTSLSPSDTMARRAGSAFGGSTTPRRRIAQKAFLNERPGVVVSPTHSRRPHVVFTRRPLFPYP